MEKKLDCIECGKELTGTHLLFCNENCEKEFFGEGGND